MIDTRAELSKFVFANSYARYNQEKQRRETFEEAVDRMRLMHLEEYGKRSPEITGIINRAFGLVKEKKVLASQRALQFAGDPIRKHNMRMYNCATSYCDRVRFFSEAFYMGLCGAGVGFSVQRVHTSCLPPLISDEEMQFAHDVDFVVEDSIEGWAQALHALITSYFEVEGEATKIPHFDFSQIRPKGTPLSSGGRAPGPEPLEEALTKVEELLQDRIVKGQEYLEPIDCFDLVMFASEAVLSGGRRRAATIAIFDRDDEAMLSAKTGAWTENYKHRQLANISARIPSDSRNKSEFLNIFSSTREYGEPGFIFTDSPHHIYNPCVEIGMCPLAIYDEHGEILQEYTLDVVNNRHKYPEYTYRSGWQVCNLTEINAGAIKTKYDFKEAVWAASVIGTLQAGFTGTGYLDSDGGVSRDIIQREYLLGVSMTGIMESFDVAGDPDLQREMAAYAKEVNATVSAMIGIGQASRVTCVKPAGTSSIILGTSSGVHPNFAHNLIRHVQVSKDSLVAKHFKALNPDHCEESQWNDRDLVIAFPLALPEDSKVRDDFTAVEFLDFIKSVQANWVDGGCRRPMSVEGASHNVSNTVRVLGDEWEQVAEYLWENRDVFTGVALLGDFGELLYPQLPNQVVYSEDEIQSKFTEDEQVEYHLNGLYKWTSLRNTMVEVDYTQVSEVVDTTHNPILEAACAGGTCDI